MLQSSVVVIQPEQQRANAIAAALVPPETGDDAVGGTGVLDFDHRPLAGLIRAVGVFRNDPIETGAFEPLQPIGRGRAIARHRRDVDWRFDAGKYTLELAATLGLWLRANVAAVDGEQVERDE